MTGTEFVFVALGCMFLNKKDEEEEKRAAAIGNSIARRMIAKASGKIVHEEVKLEEKAKKSRPLFTGEPFDKNYPVSEGYPYKL